MSQIDYNHSRNVHTLQGPQVLLPLILKRRAAGSILDVGCGRGTWLKAALEMGLADVFGVDGFSIKPDELLIPAKLFKVQDLSQPMQLGRKYELALCLEVGEHLDEASARVLIASLTNHADTIVFSAACPDQEGQHHVNCQWPEYWQQLFNECGFTCSDELRTFIWPDERIEPWYRQNIFIARRAEDGRAGTEPRLAAMVHPGVIECIVNTNVLKHTRLVTAGGMPFKWYLKLPFTVLFGRLTRRSTDKK